MKASILLRLDANHVIGLAHAIRMAGILSLMATEHRLTVAGEGELLAAFFPTAEIHPASDFFALIGKARPELVIVDHPRPGEEFWARLAATGTKTIAIDDEGGEVEADIVINGTVLDEYHLYPKIGMKSRIYAGVEYSLIRPAFEENRWLDPDAPSVLVVVGSGDRARDWALLLATKKAHTGKWGKVSMVVGQAFPEMEKLKQGCASSGIALYSGLSGEKMAKAMSEAAVALITGGMVVYETLAVGVPAVVFPQIENLIPEAKWFQQKGCIVDLGFDGGMDMDQVSGKVEELLGSRASRRALSEAARSTVDGKGMRRAAAIIDGEMGT